MCASLPVWAIKSKFASLPANRENQAGILNEKLHSIRSAGMTTNLREHKGILVSNAFAALNDLVKNPEDTVLFPRQIEGERDSSGQAQNNTAVENYNCAGKL